MAPVGRIDLRRRNSLFGRGTAASGGNRSHAADPAIHGDDIGPDRG